MTNSPELALLSPRAGLARREGWAVCGHILPGALTCHAPLMGTGVQCGFMFFKKIHVCVFSVSSAVRIYYLGLKTISKQSI